MMVDGYDGAVEDDRAKAYAVHKGLFTDLGDGRGERNRLAYKKPTKHYALNE